MGNRKGPGCLPILIVAVLAGLAWGTFGPDRQPGPCEQAETYRVAYERTGSSALAYRAVQFQNECRGE